jgi:Rrf2 family protein
MLSRRGKYGLKAMIALARAGGAGPVVVGDLAEGEAIPRKFLESIMLALKHRGLVHSRKGRYGGYQLGRPASQISVGDVVRALDGPLALVSCVSKTAYARCEECVSERTCAVRRVFQQVRDETARILDGTTLAAAAAPEARARRRATPIEPGHGRRAPRSSPARSRSQR